MLRFALVVMVAGISVRSLGQSPRGPQQSVAAASRLVIHLLVAGPDGAVAYIGCNTGSQPCGLTLAEGFAKAWGQGKDTRLGDCWAEAVSYYYDKQRLVHLKPTADWYPPSIFFQGMKFMLYGDPSLRLPR